MSVSKIIQKFKQKMKRVKFLYYPYIHIREERENKRGIELLHTYGYELLTDLMNLFLNAPFSIFCAYGTALGLVRDGEFIKTDTDMDIGIVENDIFDWEQLDKQLQAIGMKLMKEFRWNEKITERTYQRNGLRVDFFLYMKSDSGLRSNVYFRELGKEYNSDNEYEVSYYVFPYINKSISRKIHNIDILLPDNVEQYLKIAYGNGWGTYDPNFVRPVIKEKNTYAYVTFYK